jgi:hypothetical protein
MEESVAQGSWAVHWRGESECRRSCKEGLIQSTSNAMLLLSAGYQRTSKFDSAMSQPDQKSLLAKKASWQSVLLRNERLARKILLGLREG